MPCAKARRPKFKPGDRVAIHSRFDYRPARNQTATVVSVWEDRLMTLRLDGTLEIVDCTPEELSRSRTIKK